MKKLTINVLVSSPLYIQTLPFALCNIKQENKEKIIINLLTHDGNDLSVYVNNFHSSGIEAKTTYVKQGLNYMDKITQASNSDTPYCMSMDEDIFMSHHVFDYVIENVDVLGNDDFLVLAPLISNGIPTYDYFSNDFLNEQDKDSIEKILLSTKFGVNWGVDYSRLNEHTINASKWDYLAFQNSIRQIQHHYKGNHPIRENPNAVLELNNRILNNFDKFMQRNEYNTVLDNSPYFCNTVYCIKTDTWKKILNDKALFKDDFDEVPLNLYKEQNNKYFVFIKNSFCIHYMYNQSKELKEQEFNKFYEKIKEWHQKN